MIALGALLLFACSTAPSAPPATSFKTVLTVKQLMEWVIDPTVDVIWDSVKSVSTEGGTKEIAPQTSEQWDAVRNAAAALTECGNMLMLEGRARDNKEWMVAARRLSANADQAMKAAQTRDVQALFAAGGEIYKVCAACHARYAPHLNASLLRQPPELRT